METEYVYYVPDVTGKNRPPVIPQGAQQRHKAYPGYSAPYPWKPCTLPPYDWFSLSYKMEIRWPVPK